MPKTDPRVDAYIAKSAAFAQPILRHIRRLVHAGCPAVEETMKWQFPHFMYHGIICGMAAFKQHCALVFWKRALIIPGSRGTDGLGSFGKITSVDQLPADRVLLGYVKKAAQLNEAGVKEPANRRSGPRKPLVVPPWFKARLKSAPSALVTFGAFSYSHKKEYLEWITGAKTEETRERRAQKAIEQMTAGKSLNWKYEKC